MYKYLHTQTLATVTTIPTVCSLCPRHCEKIYTCAIITPLIKQLFIRKVHMIYYGVEHQTEWDKTYLCVCVLTYMSLNNFIWKQRKWSEKQIQIIKSNFLYMVRLQIFFRFVLYVFLLIPHHKVLLLFHSLSRKCVWR